MSHDSLDSFKHVDSFSNQTECSETQQFCCDIDRNYFRRKPHLAQHKYMISRRLHWMPFKLESFSREMTCILVTVISTVSVRVDVMSLPAPLAIIGSARNRQDVRLTDRSIGASLVYRQQDYHTNYTLGNYFNPVCVQFPKSQSCVWSKNYLFLFYVRSSGASLSLSLSDDSLTTAEKKISIQWNPWICNVSMV